MDAAKEVKRKTPINIKLTVTFNSYWFSGYSPTCIFAVNQHSFFVEKVLNKEISETSIHNVFRLQPLVLHDKKSTNILSHLPLHTELLTDPNSSLKQIVRHMPAPDWDVQSVATMNTISSLPFTGHKVDESIRESNTRHMLQSKMEKEKNRISRNCSCPTKNTQ